MKKILLIHPAIIGCDEPRYGLGMLSAVLIERGHLVRVADYAFSPNLPPVEKIFMDFCPDIVGISMFSSSNKVCEDVINKIREINNTVPIICGGSHVTCAYDELINNNNIDYLVIGEAESIINDIVEKAKRNSVPILIPRSPLPDVNNLPFPDYRSFINYEKMLTYPLITSRGCPYSCNFCAAGLVSSKKYRTRKIELILKEIELCKERYRTVAHISIPDDSFNIDRQRGKDLLRALKKQYSDGFFNYSLTVGNFRADLLDDELLLLFSKLGNDIVWIGVESVDEEVFNLIDKKETLDEITTAIQLINKYGMKLYLNFIIGLPGDSLEKTYKSIRFARKYKAFRIFWNLFVAYKGTSAYNWFKENGTLIEREYPLFLCDDLNRNPSNVWTSNFSMDDRLNAWRLAKIVTAEAPLVTNFKMLLSIWKKYKVPLDIMFSYPIFRFYRFKKRWLSWLKLLFKSPKYFRIRLRAALILRFKKIRTK